jgi:arsenate reductase (thioredoxin)
MMEIGGKLQETTRDELLRRNHMNKGRILFLCTHNSARSQMAEGLLRSLKGDLYEVYSAGISPTTVDPDAIDAMAEIGVDISRQRSKGLDEIAAIKFDFAVTVCDSAKEACPFFPGAKEQIHKSFDDPAAYEGKERLQAFRRVRDEIGEWIKHTF